MTVFRTYPKGCTQRLQLESLIILRSKCLLNVTVDEKKILMVFVKDDERFYSRPSQLYGDHSDGISQGERLGLTLNTGWANRNL